MPKTIDPLQPAYPLVDGLYYGAVCPDCMMLVRGEVYEQHKQLKWDKLLCKCDRTAPRQTTLF